MASPAPPLLLLLLFPFPVLELCLVLSKFDSEEFVVSRLCIVRFQVACYVHLFLKLVSTYIERSVSLLYCSIDLLDLVDAVCSVFLCTGFCKTADLGHHLR